MLLKKKPQRYLPNFIMQHKTDAIKKLIQSRYKDQDGNPFLLTDGQAEIAAAIAGMIYPRLHILTFTQFGKSDITALALITRVSSIPEKIAIVAPTDKKANIIMGYAIDHIFDNPYTLAKFQIGKDESLERIRRERRKDHITFRCEKGIGEIYTLSAEGRRTKDIISVLLGFSARRLIIDESPLLSEEHYMGIIRMIGGHQDNTLIEIGNAIGRNHFYRASRDPEYHHIVIDYEQGIREGRQRREYFDEMRRKMSPQIFSSFYECKFPPADAIDSEGYSPLLTDEELDRALVDDIQLFGEKRLGVDIAAGGENRTVGVLRASNGARKLFESPSADTMATVGMIVRKMEMEHIQAENIFIDVTGVGKGLYDRLREEGLRVTGVKNGAAAENKDDYYNVRAECYWKAAEDIKSGKLKLVKGAKWDDLLAIKYKIQSGKKIQLMPKETMLRKGIASPDTSDALALTYARSYRIDNPESRQFSDREIARLVNIY